MSNFTVFIYKNFPSHAYDGTLTFAGAIRKYFDEFTTYVGEDKTKYDYQNSYNKRILSAMDELYGPLEPIRAYTEERLDNVIDVIQANNPRIQNETTVNHYKALIIWVLREAYKNGEVDIDWWWGIRLSSQKDYAKRTNPMILKSLSPEEDLRIFKILTNDATSENGEYFGLLLMQMMGLRNNEAAGVNFSDIRQLHHYPEIFSLAISKTTKRGSNDLQPSGKTWNAVRELPLMDIVHKYLMRRRDFLESKIRSGEIKGVKNINDLPIACKGNDYGHRCSANDLTLAGKKLFKQINISQESIKALDGFVQDSPYPEATLDKDGTTYLFRRSYATHLRLMGMTVPMRKYVIGHDTEHELETRNLFQNEDRMYQIKQLIETHPICLLFRNDDSWSKRTKESLIETTYVNNKAGINFVGIVRSSSFAMKSTRPKQRILINLQEQHAPTKTQVEINAKGQGRAQVEVYQFESGRPSSRQVDTRLQMLEDYRNTLNRIT